jgi:O-antigen ligase
MNYLKKININFLLPLIIPFLILGPFFPDLIVSLSVLIFLVYVVRKKEFNYFNKKAIIIFFVFCIYCILVSIFVAKDRMLSFESSLFYFRIGIFACLIWYLIEQDKKILSYFYYTVLICFSFLAFDGYFQFFFGFNIIGLPVLSDRISSFFGDELIMGSYLSRLFPLLFALFLLKKKSSKFEVYYIGVLFILIDVLIYIAGERASFFFLNLSTLFIIFLIKKYQTFRLLTFICSLVLIVGLTFAYDKFYNRMIFDTAKGMGFLAESQKKNIFTESHESLIKTAYNMFLDKPIFGHGPKMFRVICKDEKYIEGIYVCDTHPHNFYIQLLAETGIIGFSFLFGAFAYVLYCAYRQLKSIVLRQKRYLTDYQVCLLAGILITVWPLTTNGNFFHNWLMIVYSLPVGFYLHSIYGKNKENISF